MRGGDTGQSPSADATELVISWDVVPPATAIYRWPLFSSWFLFVLTIAVNITGFLVALEGFRRQWKLAIKVLRHRTEPEVKLQTWMERHRDRVHRINVLQGTSFVCAMLCLSCYVAVNTAREMNMKQSDQTRPTQQESLEKATPSVGFLPASAPAQSTGAQISSPAQSPATGPHTSPQQGATAPSQAATPVRR